jgi:hypothetical protein
MKTVYHCQSDNISYSGSDTPEEAIQKAKSFYIPGVKINLIKISVEETFEIPEKEAAE